ncbi:esterase [Chimaeribacter arupi]|uniref:esterase n=1 Tax=Yersiniaceae TaxID=1903411 RepID=UPI000934A92C|nr:MULTISPECIES: esterase [Yersiniaceae]PLR45801.1 esterase [Chimaeribacter arupi]PLR52967.1 esterase [Chimaeribacter arupi]
MIEMFQEEINGIQVIHAAPAGKQEHALPTIFFYHGFTSSKEVYAYFGYALAQAGFRVIMPDALMHGARDNGNAGERLSHFWEILRSNIDELPGLRAAYRQRGLLIDGKVAVCGASMGGMTTLGALGRYPWIDAAASFMGSAYFHSLSRRLFVPQQAGRPLEGEALAQRLAFLEAYDVSAALDRLGNRPLLLWHGEADDLVPAEESARLAQALQQAGQAQHLTYLTEPQIGHKITPAALQACTTFFTRHLG